MILSKENGWEKIGEYIEEKFFVNNVPESPNYQTFIRSLTDEELKLFKIGEALHGLVKIVGMGYSIYRNLKTKEEIRVPKFFYDKDNQESFEIPWSDLLWQGIVENGNYPLQGQLLRICNDYYICATTGCSYQENEKLAPMIGRWHKVIPSTLERVKFVQEGLKI